MTKFLDRRVWTAIRGDSPQYEGRLYGIEVEVENFAGAMDSFDLGLGLNTNPPMLREMGRLWRVTHDGSLRNNGAEFITPPVYYPQARDALTSCYTAMRGGLFTGSVRTGIHVHCNVQNFTVQELLHFMRAYMLAEPVLFSFVGTEREQNIYCVPVYAAWNEWRRWVKVAEHSYLGTGTQLVGVLRQCCKYSALNLRPVHAQGTVEFRHAPTFGSFEAADMWLSLVRFVYEHFRLPDKPTADDLEPIREWCRRGTWDAYLARVEALGLLDRVQALLPCSYKAPVWGIPASMAFQAPPPPSRGRYASLLNPVRMSQDQLELDELSLDELVNEYTDHINDEEEQS